MAAELFQNVARKRRNPRGPWAIALGLVAAATGAYFLWRRLTPPPPPPAPIASAAPAPAPAAKPVPPPDVPVPPVTDSDTQLRDQLAGLSPLSAFKNWLAADGLLVRWVTVTDQIARDTSPRAQVPFLAPDQPFPATPVGDDYLLSARGHVRFDLLAKVARSIDPQKFAAVYRAVHPLLQTAYHQLGYPDRSIDEATQEALQRLSDAPIRERPPKIIRSGPLFVFADQSLESLGPVEKALLRMGPDNTRLLQEEARDLAAALGFTLRTAAHAERD